MLDVIKKIASTKYEVPEIVAGFYDSESVITSSHAKEKTNDDNLQAKVVYFLIYSKLFLNWFLSMTTCSVGECLH